MLRSTTSDPCANEVHPAAGRHPGQQRHPGQYPMREWTHLPGGVAEATPTSRRGHQGVPRESRAATDAGRHQ
jgi:hypothetical protein